MSIARSSGMGWIDILRCGLVQTALGAIVVLTTSTYNRVMVVELALPAMVPGALVALHYAIQLSRPRWGYGSDMGARRTNWIIGGVAVLGIGAVLAAIATGWMQTAATAGMVLAVFSFVLIGAGVGAAGTSLLALLATQVDPARRAAAATITWLMMILGIAVTATIAGKMLDPFSPERLIAVAASIAGIALLVTLLATWRLERSNSSSPEQSEPSQKPPFRQVFAEVWAEPEARRFSIFVFVSMLAYNTQDLILEPFAGLVFGMTPGESTQLTGVQHGGVFLGMILVALAGSSPLRRWIGSLKGWTVWGCIGSSVMMASLSLAGIVGPEFPLQITVFLLGLANGAFAVAAIGSMMKLAGYGRPGREGIRMGVWGAAQALAFGIGGFMGTILVDITQAVFRDPALAYGSVFSFEGVLFLISAILAARIDSPDRPAQRFMAAPAE
jgi:MFS transporter, BCD family, chlorophyll transporter